MGHFKIDGELIGNDMLPPFSLTIESEKCVVIYSDTDMQVDLVKALQEKEKRHVFDLKEGLYERLTVEQNIKFFRQWFASAIPLAEVLVLFELQNCADKALHQCSDSEIQRVFYAKYYLSNQEYLIFQEPIQSVDITTMNTFMKMIHKLKEQSVPVLILVSNMEHALLLGDVGYKLQQSGLRPIEMEEADTDGKEKTPFGESSSQTTVNLFKIPAKVDEKVILFDPPEIDYIESQNGKPIIVINDETYALDSTLKEIEEKIEVYGFYRCHRSYIVNLQKVREIITWSKNTYSLRINNKIQSTIPLSRTKIQEIQEKFSLQ